MSGEDDDTIPFGEGDWVESKLNAGVFGIVVGFMGAQTLVQLVHSLAIQPMHYMTLRPMDDGEPIDGGRKPIPTDNVINLAEAKVERRHEGSGLMAKFKVGDRVRVIDNAGGGKLGDECTIEVVHERDECGVYYEMKGPSSGHCGLYEKRLELVAPAFKIGDRVRLKVSRSGYMSAKAGATATVYEKTDRYLRVNWDKNALSNNQCDGGFYIEDFELIPSLNIQAGKFYKTRDGRKVGPYQHVFSDIWRVGVDHSTAVYEDGTTSRSGVEHNNDLIAEWVDEPAKPKFKVGDFITRPKGFGYSWKEEGYKVTKIAGGRVYLDSGNDAGYPASYDVNGEWVVVTSTNPAIVCLIENGQPKPSDFPHVHADRDAAATEAARLARRFKGKKFGVYELVSTKEEAAPVYEHEWQRLAADGNVIPAIKELRSKTGMTLKGAKDAVDHWRTLKVA